LVLLVLLLLLLLFKSRMAQSLWRLDYGLEDPGLKFQQEKEIFFLFKASRTPMPMQRPLQWAFGGFSPERNAAGAGS
jgi:hypothetical protein